MKTTDCGGEEGIISWIMKFVFGDKIGFISDLFFLKSSKQDDNLDHRGRVKPSSIQTLNCQTYLDQISFLLDQYLWYQKYLQIELHLMTSLGMCSPVCWLFKFFWLKVNSDQEMLADSHTRLMDSVRTPTVCTYGVYSKIESKHRKHTWLFSASAPAPKNDYHAIYEVDFLCFVYKLFAALNTLFSIRNRITSSQWFRVQHR